MTVSLFRALILTEMLLLSVSFLAGWFGDPFLPERMRDYEDASLAAASPAVDRIITWLFNPRPTHLRGLSRPPLASEAPRTSPCIL